MTANIESLTTATLSLALDVASLRQQIIAGNIANASDPNFGAQRVSFEARLLQASKANPKSSDEGTPAFEVDMRIDGERDAAGQPRPAQLDAEVALLTQNSMHYQALVRAISKHMGILASAVSEGKR